jgi:hypothetical protein
MRELPIHVYDTREELLRVTHGRAALLPLRECLPVSAGTVQEIRVPTRLV